MGSYWKKVAQVKTFVDGMIKILEKTEKVVYKRALYVQPCVYIYQEVKSKDLVTSLFTWVNDGSDSVDEGELFLEQNTTSEVYFGRSSDTVEIYEKESIQRAATRTLGWKLIALLVTKIKKGQLKRQTVYYILNIKRAGLWKYKQYEGIDRTGCDGKWEPEKWNAEMTERLRVSEV